jgi:Ca2+-transporting ATPase
MRAELRMTRAQNIPFALPIRTSRAGTFWVGLLSGLLLWRRHGLRFIGPFLAGGFAYTIGAVLEFRRWPNPWPGVIHAHELFHLFVIAGAAWHWQFCSMIAKHACATERFEQRMRAEG